MKQCFYFVVFLLSLGEVFTAGDYNLGCSKYEVVDPCKNPCPPTCQDPVPPICNSLLCSKGCVCKKGLIRNEKTNRCVPPSWCPDGKPNCGENQEWTNCGAGCVQTCQNINNPPICTEECKPGCICRRGLIFDEVSGTCIPLDKCPKPVCNGTNEEYSECTSPCTPTCQTPCRPPVFCPAVCIRGCACKRGYIRDEVTSQCILPDNCPKCR